jgi:hypothetical protein
VRNYDYVLGSSCRWQLKPINLSRGNRLRRLGWEVPRLKKNKNNDRYCLFSRRNCKIC